MKVQLKKATDNYYEIKSNDNVLLGSIYVSDKTPVDVRVGEWFDMIVLDYTVSGEDLQKENTPTIPVQGKKEEDTVMENLSRSHQTAVFLDGEALRTNSNYAERAKRLVGSLNRSGHSSSTIKADIFTVFSTTENSGIVPGIVTDAPKGNGFDIEAIHAIAKNSGFTLVNIVLA